MGPAALDDGKTPLQRQQERLRKRIEWRKQRKQKQARLNIQFFMMVKNILTVIILYGKLWLETTIFIFPIFEIEAKKTVKEELQEDGIKTNHTMLLDVMSNMQHDVDLEAEEVAEEVEEEETNFPELCSAIKCDDFKEVNSRVLFCIMNIGFISYIVWVGTRPNTIYSIRRRKLAFHSAQICELMSVPFSLNLNRYRYRLFWYIDLRYTDLDLKALDIIFR